MSETPEYTILPMFCKAAGHEPGCMTWAEHRSRLDLALGGIMTMINMIPDAIAVGKARQEAAKQGQTSLTGETFHERKEVVDIRDPKLGPAPVNWFYVSDEKRWHTSDRHVKRNCLQYMEDCRAATIESYKPREVEIYFDGEPDEWNGKR